MSNNFIVASVVLSKLLLFFCLSFSPAEAQTLAGSGRAEREVVGWVEKTRVFPPDIVFHSKLDTGVSLTSLHAENIQVFKRDGKRFVRFLLRSRYGEELELERRVIAVKRGATKQYFVRLGICLGKFYLESDVLLEDRSEYQERLRLGRDFLSGNLIVDSSVMYTSLPECSPNKARRGKMRKQVKASSSAAEKLEDALSPGVPKEQGQETGAKSIAGEGLKQGAKARSASGPKEPQATNISDEITQGMLPQGEESSTIVVEKPSEDSPQP